MHACTARVALLACGHATQVRFWRRRDDAASLGRPASERAVPDQDDKAAVATHREGSMVRSRALKKDKLGSRASGASISEALDASKRPKTDKPVPSSKAVPSSSQDQLLKARMSYDAGATRAPTTTGTLSATLSSFSAPSITRAGNKGQGAPQGTQQGAEATQGKDGQADWALGADLLGAARKSYT